MTASATEPDYRRRFTALLHRPEEGIDFAEAALLIACQAYPQLEMSNYQRLIESWGAEARARVNRSSSPGFVDVLNQFLFEELGFRGNQDDYYDPRNSYLNDVLDRRLGIPLSLSAVYVEIGRRAGLQVDGVGLPGHFIVRVTLKDQDQEQDQDQVLLIDPFHGGLVLSEADCQRRLDRIFDGKLRMDSSMLAACGPRQMLARMLQNLKSIFARGEDDLKTLEVVELLLRIDPEDAQEIRDRGLLYAALDCYALAARDLTTYLARTPSAPDAEDLLARLAMLEEQAARMH